MDLTEMFFPIGILNTFQYRQSCNFFSALALSLKEEYHIFSHKYYLHLGGLHIDINQNGILFSALPSALLLTF